jgi:hypothetical protein
VQKGEKNYAKNAGFSADFHLKSGRFSGFFPIFWVFSPFIMGRVEHLMKKCRNAAEGRQPSDV